MNRKNQSDAMSHAQIEEGTGLWLDFEKLKKVAACAEPVLPVAVQHADTGELLIVAYANEAAVQYTLTHRIAAFWSTSRNELWIKGKTSGDILEIVDVLVNCEQNSLVYRVRLRGQGSCHTKNHRGISRQGCYYRRVRQDGALELLEP